WSSSACSAWCSLTRACPLYTRDIRATQPTGLVGAYWWFSAFQRNIQELGKESTVLKTCLVIFVLGAVSTEAALLVFGAEVLAILLRAPNTWGLRSRMPLLHSGSKLKTALGWSLLLMLSCGALGVVLTLTPLVHFTSAALAAEESQLKSTEELLRPSGRYQDYALSRDTSSFDSENPQTKALLERFGQSPPIRKKGDGFVQIYAASAQTELNVPLGWYVAETGNKTLIFSPDEKMRFILRFADTGKPDFDFSQAKQQLRDEFQQAYARLSQ